MSIILLQKTFYENHLSLFQAFDNNICRFHEANKKKNEINCLLDISMMMLINLTNLKREEKNFSSLN